MRFVPVRWWIFRVLVPVLRRALKTARDTKKGTQETQRALQSSECHRGRRPPEVPLDICPASFLFLPRSGMSGATDRRAPVSPPLSRHPRLLWVGPAYRRLSSFQRASERSAGRDICSLKFLTGSRLSVRVTAAGELYLM